MSYKAVVSRIQIRPHPNADRLQLGPIFVVNFVDDRERLQALVELLARDRSSFGDHIREGVAVRIESDQVFDILKSKSFTFGVLEGYLKEDDSFVDREEAA